MKTLVVNGMKISIESCDGIEFRVEVDEHFGFKNGETIIRISKKHKEDFGTSLIKMMLAKNGDIK